MENQDFLTKQLITYLGNKRALLAFIGRGIDEIRTRTGKEKLHMADLFSGSGVVSRYFKQYAASLLANDLEGYCRTISRCYLSNPDENLLRRIDVPQQISGYEYQVMECAACLAHGQTESRSMPLDETVDVMALMDSIRAQWGLVYPQEK